jgi:hypothetical protein
MLRGNTTRLARWSLEDRFRISLITICIPKLTSPLCWRFLERHDVRFQTRAGDQYLWERPNR